MKMSKLVGRRIKEVPKDAKNTSHQFLIRGGYIRPVSAGIYNLLPLGKRITDKIEKIIREEMDRIDGEEITSKKKHPSFTPRLPNVSKKDDGSARAQCG